MTPEKAALGRRLFFDVRLSLNGTQSCASCHDPARAYSDGRRHAIGSTGEEHFRNSASLTNVAFRQPLTWASRRASTLEAQVLIPLTHEHPIELGMKGHFEELLQRLRSDPAYPASFQRAFPGQADPISIENLARAIATFERTILYADSPFDRAALNGENNALSEAAWRGMKLFHSERLRCGSCHGGLNFSTPAGGEMFQNNGFWSRGTDRGLAMETHRRQDRGLFRVPTLRNIAVTGPYMHDGGLATLGEVIDYYKTGGIVRGHRPHGSRIPPFALAAGEKEDLIAFLESLTDRSVMRSASMTPDVPLLSPAVKTRGHLRGRRDAGDTAAGTAALRLTAPTTAK